MLGACQLYQHSKDDGQGGSNGQADDFWCVLQ